MNYKDNIDYRENLEKKFFSSQKLTDAEKQWCIANPVFNGRFDFPCYKRDVISIPREQKIKIKVNALRYTDNAKIYRPVISVVGKGQITVENEFLNTDFEK